jgi:DNA polymerase III epsilon subunit-like protein
MNTYIVFDLETNGFGTFRPPTQTITQIAFIKFNSNGETLDQYSTIVSGATRVNTGPAVTITLDSIQTQGVDPVLAYTRFIDAIEEDTIIYAHNAEFDVELLKRALIGTDLVFPTNRVICTMKQSVDLCRIPKTGRAARYGGYKWPALSDLASRLNVEVDHEQFHDALYDCLITKECILQGQHEGIFI